MPVASYKLTFYALLRETLLALFHFHEVQFGESRTWWTNEPTRQPAAGRMDGWLTHGDLPLKPHLVERIS